MIFNAHDYAALHAAVFRPDYPGYKPDVVEAPNGDGKLDVRKRYAHVATKYLDAWTPANLRDAALKMFLGEAFRDAYDHAWIVAERLGVPRRSARRSAPAPCACLSTDPASAARSTRT